MIKTLQNITRNLKQSNEFDAASAPTGCAASLFGGKTHHRLFSLPGGPQNLCKPPTDQNTTKVNDIIAFNK